MTDRPPRDSLDDILVDDSERAGLPPIGLLVRGSNGLLPIYVLGAVDREDEGILGVDLRVRPVELGIGAYTMAAAPDCVGTMRGLATELSGNPRPPVPG